MFCDTKIINTEFAMSTTIRILRTHVLAVLYGLYNCTEQIP